MSSSELVCTLLAYEHLVPRGEIFGVKVTVTKVAAAVIPVVSAVIPKVLLALGTYSQTH